MTRGLLALVLVISWTGVSWANISVLGGLAHEMTLNPGQVYEGAFVLKNTGGTPGHVRIYQTDYSMFTGGLTIYGDPGTSPRSNAGWISLGPRRVRVPPRSTARVHYRITVPETLSLRGTYWSIIMVEPVTSAGSQLVPDETGRNLLGVETVVRYGIQIVTDIGDAGNRQIRFLGKRLIEVGDTRMLEIDIENVGEWWLSPDFYLEIYDESGRRSHRFEGGRKRIYPGCSVTHQVDLTDVPAGSYTALAILDNREEDVFGAQYNLWIDR